MTLTSCKGPRSWPCLDLTRLDLAAAGEVPDADLASRWPQTPKTLLHLNYMVTSPPYMATCPPYTATSAPFPIPAPLRLPQMLSPVAPHRVNPGLPHHPTLLRQMCVP